jgi:hypothetical protein
VAGLWSGATEASVRDELILDPDAFAGDAVTAHRKQLRNGCGSTGVCIGSGKPCRNRLMDELLGPLVVFAAVMSLTTHPRTERRAGYGLGRVRVNPIGVFETALFPWIDPVFR